MDEGCDLIFSILTTFSFDFSNNQALESALRKSLPMIYHEISAQSFDSADIYVLSTISLSVINQDIFLLKREDEIRLCFEVAFILMFQYIHKQNIMIENDLTYDMNTMLEMYPDYLCVDEEEKQKLLLFRNAMKVAMLIIPAKSHKNHLLAIVTRMTEGREVKYVTGSGQTVVTTRRVLIYETEGDIKPKPRPPRKKKDGESSSSKSFITGSKQSNKSQSRISSSGSYIVSLSDISNIDLNDGPATRVKRGLSNYSSCPQTNARSLRSSGETDHEFEDNDENDYSELLSALAFSMTECQVSPLALHRVQSDVTSVSENSVDEAAKDDEVLDLDILDFVASFSPLTP